MTTIRLPTGFNITSYLSSGITSMVYLDSSSNTVIKYPHQEEKEPTIEVERRIYEWFQKHGGHEGLLYYHGTFESGIRLEYASKNGPRQYIQTHEIDTKQRLQWAQQVTSSLAFVHSMNVVLADLTCNNISLDNSLHAKLLGFSGSSFDGSNPFIVVTASHKCSGEDLKSTRADLFALGSTLYEIWTDKPPYYDLGLKEMEITGLFKQSKFPETKSLGRIGEIITGCWQGRFGSANEVLEAINSCVRTSSIAPSTLETTIIVSVLGLLLFIAHKLTRR
ncbi:kinase-like domain-containing protein [Rhexocercosporidium sp. MPI-PUGE-AT-0058]|nr:kinase-like domain-containing protein [Rhexocercosporidium sp. MPI-PUGE-AT-0058]